MFGGNKEGPTESTPLFQNQPSSSTLPSQPDDEDYSTDDLDEFDDTGNVYFANLKTASIRRESMAADALSTRLLAIADDDSEAEERILRESLQLDVPLHRRSDSFKDLLSESARMQQKAARNRFISMALLAFVSFAVIGTALYVGVQFIGPPNVPAGPYRLLERQEGENFFDFWSFYEGPDSAGSNGYITYVSEARAKVLGIANVTMEKDDLDVYFADDDDDDNNNSTRRKRRRRKLKEQPEEPFLYMKTAPTPNGPRESIRLEGKRRYNRGLFIIDLRHMPQGCGLWPAFWMTDEANWPVNGEIDIVEGVNYQTEAKTALHTTKQCDMYDVPQGTMTGTWDTAVGIPDRKTGIPDMTFREARNCFVYDPHQWLNQGCVSIDTDGGSLGVPLNKKGGGVFALEWDPQYKHLRSWVFSPHTAVPENLVKAIRTAHKPESQRVMPDPDQWPLPYGYFPIGEGTNCGSYHFKNMRLVLNTAFCGSVAGNRFQIDCKKESKEFKTCNEYIKSEPDALKEAYWKIRGVYVYERDWVKTWAH
eukprot:CAMPEP_0113647456 /NCGR_PEP_ID=MMETSP0017_2-20120614/25118_1 /TAXON_ID=2856 /ORGANISM="Cylindrotheca closterium" /LENGTH=535 /DNA_ID=CAMNT_0000559509 /DNA_START=176 /DNA_END=1783 /DNA_ORIENTATION=+ /assembly_acc=CAM_ASM_000147